MPFGLSEAAHETFFVYGMASPPRGHAAHDPVDHEERPSETHRPRSKSGTARHRRAARRNRAVWRSSLTSAPRVETPNASSTEADPDIERARRSVVISMRVE